MCTRGDEVTNNKSTNKIELYYDENKRLIYFDSEHKYFLIEISHRLTNPLQIKLNDTNFIDAINRWFINKETTERDYGNIIQKWDTSNITDMRMAFRNRVNFNVDISNGIHLMLQIWKVCFMGQKVLIKIYPNGMWQSSEYEYNVYKSKKF